MKAMPKTLYVRHESDDDDGYFVSEEKIRNHCNLEEKVIVGQYKLVQVLAVTGDVFTKPVKA